MLRLALALALLASPLAAAPAATRPLPQDPAAAETTSVETATDGAAETAAAAAETTAGAGEEAAPEDTDALGEAAGQAGAAAEGLRDMVIDFLANSLQVPTGVAELIGKIVVFVVILVVFRILASILASIVGGALSKSRIRPSQLLLEFLKGTTSKLTMLIGLVMALAAVGVNVAPLLAGIGVLGFVVGFALQDTLGNFAAGVMILLYRPFDVGDFVTAGGVTGTVKSMNLVSTTLATPDNQVQIVPNGSIWGGVITNVTANETRRVDLVAGVSYGDDVDKVEATLKRIVESHELVLKDPAPVVKLHQLADSSVNFVVRPWCKTSDYWTVYWDLTAAFKREFDKEGISIPFPQRDVHLYKVAAWGGGGGGRALPPPPDAGSRATPRREARAPGPG